MRKFSGIYLCLVISRIPEISFFLPVVREQQGRLLHEGRGHDRRGKAHRSSTLIQTRRSERTHDDNQDSWVSQESSDHPAGL